MPKLRWRAPTAAPRMTCRGLTTQPPPSVAPLRRGVVSSLLLFRMGVGAAPRARRLTCSRAEELLCQAWLLGRSSATARWASGAARAPGHVRVPATAPLMRSCGLQTAATRGSLPGNRIELKTNKALRRRRIRNSGFHLIRGNADTPIERGRSQERNQVKMAHCSAGAYDAPPTPPPPPPPATVLDLLPDLSDDEKQRMRLQGCLPERDEDIPRFPPVPQPASIRSYDDTILPTVLHALHHYNARHPGGEFDVAKPLMEDGVHYRDEAWSHINFWARSRSTKKIKRFFAEVHYKPPECSDPSFLPPCIATVETCTIIEEPLACAVQEDLCILSQLLRYFAPHG